MRSTRSLKLSVIVLAGTCAIAWGQEIVTNYVTADQSFRRVDGKLYNVNKSVLWTNIVKGECIRVLTHDIIVQQYDYKLHQTRAPIAARRDFMGNRSNPRSIVTSEETEKIPTKKLLLRNFPAIHEVTIGTKVEVRALRAAPANVGGERLECWDCGTPNVVAVVNVKTNSPAIKP